LRYFVSSEGVSITGTGGVFDALISRVSMSERPRLSETVNVAMYVPGSAYVCEASTPATGPWPSPNFQL
jgi:hypothetical protein